MELSDGVVTVASIGEELIDENSNITLEELGRRMDVLGNQMNWLCDNLASLFVFVQQVGSNGGGIRGLMKAMKQEAPNLQGVDTNG